MFVPLKWTLIVTIRQLTYIWLLSDNCVCEGKNKEKGEDKNYFIKTHILKVELLSVSSNKMLFCEICVIMNILLVDSFLAKASIISILKIFNFEDFQPLFFYLSMWII